jgi:peptidoglycan/LPS O-acetylase OafA/YrhL
MLPVTTDRIESAEILRGLAAFAVAWFHFTCGNRAFLSEGSLLWLSGSRGYLGVHLFFVISGFVIPYSLSRRKYAFPDDALAFFVRRLVRLEPAYLCSIVLTVGLWALSAMIPGSEAVLPPLTIFRSMVLQIAYLAPWSHVPWILPVYWSLAIEIQYYLFMIVMSPLSALAEAVSYPILLVSYSRPFDIIQ